MPYDPLFDCSIVQFQFRLINFRQHPFVMNLQTAEHYSAIERTILPSTIPPFPLHLTLTPFSLLCTASTLLFIPLVYFIPFIVFFVFLGHMPYPWPPSNVSR